MSLPDVDRKALITRLLKGLESGDPASVAVVNEAQYIQHNPQTHEGSEGLAELFQRIAKTDPKVNIVRIFEDGDFIFAHTEYDFAERNIGFEIFRFQDGYAVEHWDNIQRRKGPNPSGHSMVDGPCEITDRALTNDNRYQVADFIQQVLLEGQLDRIESFIDTQGYTEHNPVLEDDLQALRLRLSAVEGQAASVQYHRCHRILAEGNFVLTVSEGQVDGVPSSFFDLFRLHEGMIVEHWDTTEEIPPREEWKNNNGKF